MRLIINADDFGLSKSVTDGIIKGIKEGYITSTTIMVNMEYAKYAIEEAIKNKINCIGLHINLTVGKPLIPNKKLTNEDGTFKYNRKQIENPELTYIDAYNEIKAQIEKVKELSNGLIQIDHLDTHHILVDNKYIKKAITELALEYNIPVRNENYTGIKCPDVLEPYFTIENVNIESLKEIIERRKNTNKTIEIMTHAGLIDEYTKTVTSYIGRDKELNVLKEAKQKGLFNNVKLISFKEL